nr:MAG TPA: nucleoporin [Caudoviricetes sp.]
MSNQNVTFEQMYAAIIALTEALKENTASRNKAISKAEAMEQVAKTAEKVVDAIKAEAETKQSENAISTELVEAALLEVKNKFGADAAKQIIKDVAGVARVKGIPEDKYQDVIDACEAKMDEPKQGDAETDADAADTVTETEITLDDVKAAAKEFGRQSQAHLAKAKEIIKEVGKADKIADVEPKYYAALVEALQNAKVEDDDDL